MEIKYFNLQNKRNMNIYEGYYKNNKPEEMEYYIMRMEIKDMRENLKMVILKVKE